jgi:transposase-like protein
LSDKQLIKEAYKTFDPHQEECPNCHAKQLKPMNSSYIRHLRGTENTPSLIIDRYKCPICKRTHALLPDIIIPYSRYSLRFKLDAIKTYYQRSGSVETLCADLNIAISTLYRWLKKYKEHKAHYLGALGDQETPPLSFLDRLRYGTELSQILKHFFITFNISFLQYPPHSHPRHTPQFAAP